jgi:septum formation protein
MKLLLASMSTTRRGMLEAAGVAFDAVPAMIDEDARKAELQHDGLAAHVVAKTLAEMKALSVLDAVDTLIIGCDQTLEYGDGETFDKPKTRDEAFDQLKALSGRSHFLHSAVAIAENKKIVWRHSDTVRLTMRKLSDEFIDSYLDVEFEDVRNSVGGYHIEGRGAQLFDWVEGSHFAIQGLPLLPLLKYLRERSILMA